MSWPVIAGATRRDRRCSSCSSSARACARSGARVDDRRARGWSGARAVGGGAARARRAGCGIGGELWNAASGRDGARSGAEVEVTGVEGLTLRVRPLAKEARS